jgi:hypothetical protein
MVEYIRKVQHIKGVIRSSKLKDSQYMVKIKLKKTRRKNNGSQTLHRKQKIRQHEPH